MNAALLCDEFEELDERAVRIANPARRKPLRAAARFERTSLDRYHTQSRFSRRPARAAASGLHHRRLKQC